MQAIQAFVQGLLPSQQPQYPPSPILPNALVGGPEVLEVTLYEGYDGTLIIARVKRDMGGIGVRYRCSFTPTEFVDTKGAQNSVSPDNWIIFARMAAASQPKAQPDHWLLASLADKPEVQLAGGSGSALDHSTEKSAFEDDAELERGGWTGCLPWLWVPCGP